MEQAINAGAVALFGEKYGDTVRTIKFGKSMELCGGTHVQNTADIWHFKIKSESAIAAGIRRIEAITNDAVKEYFNSQDEELIKIKEILKGTTDSRNEDLRNFNTRTTKLIQQIKDQGVELQKELELLQKAKAKNVIGDLKNELIEINGIQFLAKKLDLDASGIKDVSFDLGKHYKNLFLLFAAQQKGKALLSCYISKELVASKDLDAGKVVRELGKLIHGGGGGQPFFATAGGKHPEGIKEALEKAKNYLN
jgi:alanyl-tRNA synthetase